jgi:hypothetical protein
MRSSWLAVPSCNYKEKSRKSVLLDILTYVVTHGVPGIQAARDAGIQNIDTKAIRSYVDIRLDALEARAERMRNGR